MDDKLANAVQEIIRVSNPLRIVLFGSYARGDAGVESDVDILVVKENINDLLQESFAIRGALRKLKLAFDITLATEEKYRHWRDTVGHLYYEIEQEGKVLYEAA